MSSLKFGFDQDRLARIDDWQKHCLEIDRFAGSSVLVARGGNIVHQSAFGKRSLDRDLPFELETAVRVYSMTELVASLGFMMLVEKGLVHLDAPVSNFLPEFSDCRALVEGATGEDQTVKVDAPSLHQLLTHTSGMSYAFNDNLMASIYTQHGVDFGPASGGLEAASKRAAAMPLAFRPGEKWEYSVGIDIIGRVIEVISGKSLDAYLRDEIFAPLGMNETTFGWPDYEADRLADCYVKDGNDQLALMDSGANSEFLASKVETFSGGGGLISTLNDFFKFGEMIRKGGETPDGERLVSPATLTFMRRNHLPGDIASMGPGSFAEMPMNGVGFGLGGAVVLDPALSKMPGSVGDYGWGGMASTYFWTDPVLDLTCLYYTQLVPSSTYPNRAEFKALVHGAFVS